MTKAKRAIGKSVTRRDLTPTNVLFEDVRELILAARQHVATAANATLTLL